LRPVRRLQGHRPQGHTPQGLSRQPQLGLAGLKKRIFEGQDFPLKIPSNATTGNLFFELINYAIYFVTEKKNK